MAEHQRFFEKGDSVLTLTAYAAVLHKDLLKSNCSFCFARLPEADNSAATRRRVFCHDCGITKYCDRDCQSKDFSPHRLECEIVRRCSSVPPDFHRLLIRVCGRYDSEKSKGTCFVQRVLDTDTFVGDCGTIPPEVVQRYEDDNFYLDMIPNWTDLDKHEVSILLEQTVATSVHIFFVGAYIGWGVYPGLACLPNTCRRYEAYVNVFDGTTFVFRATKPFVLRSIDDIPVSMVHRGLSKYRREKLLRELGIECECKRCESEPCTPDEPNRQLENVLNDGDNELVPRVKYACCLLLLRRFRSYSDGHFDKFRLLLELQSLCNKLEKTTDSITYASRIGGFHEQVDYERSLLNLLQAAKCLSRCGKPDELLLNAVTRRCKDLILHVYQGNSRTFELNEDLEHIIREPQSQ